MVKTNVEHWVIDAAAYCDLEGGRRSGPPISWHRSGARPSHQRADLLGALREMLLAVLDGNENTLQALMRRAEGNLSLGQLADAFDRARSTVLSQERRAHARMKRRILNDTTFRALAFTLLNRLPVEQRAE